MPGDWISTQRQRQLNQVAAQNRGTVPRPPERSNLPPWQRPDENWPHPLPGTIPNKPVLVPSPLPPATPPAPLPAPTPAPIPTPGPGPAAPPAGARLMPGMTLGNAGIVPGAVRAAQPQPPAPAPWVDPDAEKLRATLAEQKRREEENRQPFIDAFNWLADQGELIRSKLEAKFAAAAVAAGFVGKKAAGFLAPEILDGGGLGVGEEAEIARMNEAHKNQRARLADFAFTLLRLTPPFTGGAGVVVAPPQEQADP